MLISAKRKGFTQPASIEVKPTECNTVIVAPYMYIIAYFKKFVNGFDNKNNVYQ